MLNLDGNNIGNEGAAAIAKMLEVGSQPILSPIRLHLSYPGLNIVSYAFRASLAAANRVFSIDFLQVNKYLTSLDMSWNKQITDKGWAEIAKGLAVSIRAVFHPMAPEMSAHNRYAFSMHIDPGYPPANRVFLLDF